MPKIKVKKFENYEFVYRTKVKVRDVNYGGHLSNDAMVGLLHEARIDFLEQMGFTELNLGDDKTGIIMSDIAVSFKSEGFLLDDIVIFSHIDEMTDATFRVYHKVVRGETVLALAETGIVAFDYDKKSISDIPQCFIERLKRWNSSEIEFVS